MLNILFTLLILLLVLGIVYWIVGLIPLEQPIKNIIMAIIGVMALIYLLSILFGAAPAPVLFR
jgi:hypothetical protein